MAQIAQQQWKQIGVDLQIKASTNIVQDLSFNHLSNMASVDVVRSGLDAISTIFTPGHLGIQTLTPGVTPYINLFTAYVKT